jgi:hypothetical protein
MKRLEKENELSRANYKTKKREEGIQMQMMYAADAR